MTEEAIVSNLPPVTEEATILPEPELVLDRGYHSSDTRNSTRSESSTIVSKVRSHRDRVTDYRN